jgi:hypothetical protein
MTAHAYLESVLSAQRLPEPALARLQSLRQEIEGLLG